MTDSVENSNTFCPNRKKKKKNLQIVFIFELLPGKVQMFLIKAAAAVSQPLLVDTDTCTDHFKIHSF